MSFKGVLLLGLTLLMASAAAAQCVEMPYKPGFFVVATTKGYPEYWGYDKGSGKFSLVEALNDVNEGEMVAARDFDLDGDIDILSYSYEWQGRVKFWLYKRVSGDANCFEKVLLDDSPALDEEPEPCDKGAGWCRRENVVVDDFTGDGFPDFILMQSTNMHRTGTEFYLYTNNKGEGFARGLMKGLNADWAEWPSSGEGMLSGDFDNDSDQDFLLLDMEADETCMSLKARFYENRENGRFLNALDGDEFLTKNTVDELWAADLTLNGVLDILAGPSRVGDPGQLWIHKGKGSGRFDQGLPIIDILPNNETCSAGEPKGMGLTSAFDFTGDGRADLLICQGESSNKLSLLEGAEVGYFEEWKKRGSVMDYCEGKPFTFAETLCSREEKSCSSDSDCCALGEEGYPYAQQCSKGRCCREGEEWNGSGCGKANEKPFAMAPPGLEGVQGQALEIKGQGTDEDGVIEGIEWRVEEGDCGVETKSVEGLGTKHAEIVSELVCSEPGEKTAVLTVRDDLGASSSGESTIMVWAAGEKTEGIDVLEIVGVKTIPKSVSLEESIIVEAVARNVSSSAVDADVVLWIDSAPQNRKEFLNQKFSAGEEKRFYWEIERIADIAGVKEFENRAAFARAELSLPASVIEGEKGNNEKLAVFTVEGSKRLSVPEIPLIMVMAVLAVAALVLSRRA